MYICSAVGSETVIAALDSAVFDVEEGVAHESEGRKKGVCGVVDRVSAEVNSNLAAVLYMEVSAVCKAVLVLIEVVEVEALALDGLDVVAKVDPKVLVCGASLSPRLCECAEALYLV